MHSHYSRVSGSGVVSVPLGSGRLRADSTADTRTFNDVFGSRPRTIEKQTMAARRLEDIWKERLTQDGWSDRASSQYLLCLAKSTRVNYNSLLAKCERFCTERRSPFPPNKPAILADFLCMLSDSSNRPRSLICSALAALSNVYSHLEIMDLTKLSTISKLCNALIKSGTKQPIKKSKVLPMDAFQKLFSSWETNSQLSITNLRLKAITLLALAIMLRPSDIAPKGEIFDHISGDTKKYLFTTDMLSFDSEGLTVTFIGIKNDTQRSGFEVYIPRSKIFATDPVSTLQSYIERTSNQRTDKAVFISVKKPFSALSASSVSKILESAIILAGLDGQGFSAKSFRPTGATRAIDSGMDPNIVQKIGRWKCTEVFRNHYVHSKTPSDYTETLFDNN